MNLSQFIRTSQIQTLKQLLSPKMITMLKTFQKPYSELVSDIETELKDNVLLEVKQQDELSSYHQSTDSSDFMGKDISEIAKDTHQETIIEFVRSQVDLLNLADKDHKITEELINHMDERGYIPDYDSIRETLVSSSSAINARKVNECLSIIQELEPDGVGARSLKECLLIQVENTDFESQELKQILHNIISKHLDDLAQEKYDYIAKKCKIQVEGVIGIQDYIKQNLNPNPGSNFSQSSLNHHIVPSFEISLDQGSVVLTNLEEQKGVQLQLSESYLKLLHDPETDEKTKTFLNEKLEKAKELIEILSQRHQSLYKIIDYISKKQPAFIRRGILYLEPLLQKDIAKELGLSASTISRIVSSKYVLTPHGLFSLKQLCPRNHFGKTSKRFELLIKDFLEKNPGLSDSKITKKLNDENIPIARRTVTKYRLLLGINSSLSKN